MDGPNEKSKYFYIRLTGDYGLITSPETKGGGEKATYPVITKQAVLGILDACYFKPVLKNVVDEVKVINPIRTHTMGVRVPKDDYKQDRSNITYLVNPEYLIKYHFEWNLFRDDLKKDRNMKKHEAIMQRSIERGGRRSIFIGASECQGYVNAITKEEYESKISYYEGQTLSFGLMFNSFKYPNKPGEKLYSYFGNVIMKDGIINFKDQEDCEVKNELSTYGFKYPEQELSVDEEYAKLEGRWLNDTD